VDAVVALGRLADGAFRTWRATSAGQSVQVAYEHITHPTRPESSSRGNRQKYDDAMRAMLDGWNEALQRLAPAIRHQDVARELRLYGEALSDDDVSVIPEQDMPAGLPSWMRSPRAWAARQGKTTELKRASLVVTVPTAERPWSR
jgi:hypothetical protein